MNATDRLALLWARLLAWFADLRPAGGSNRATVSGTQRNDLITLLNKGHPGERWLAAEALGEADPGREGVAALAVALGSDDPILRAEAGNALAQIGGKTARGALLQSAASRDSVAQAVAADALAKMPADEAAAQVLQTLLDSPRAVVRQSAAEALARTGWPPLHKSAETRPDPGPRLLELLTDDPEPMVRRAAALALGKLGDPAAREALSARLEDSDEDWRVREAAALAVSRLRADSVVADSGESKSRALAEAETPEPSD